MSKKKLKDDLSDLIADDVLNKPIVLDDKKLDELSEKVNRVANLEEQILDAEITLQELNKKYHTLAFEEIPDLFDELGLSQLKLSDGTSITIKRRYLASITEENKGNCFKWLKINNHDSIIKHDITVNLKKGEKKEATKIIGILKKIGVTFKDKEHIHPKTLEAFVKEQIENGEKFPQETFKVFPLRQAKVKLDTM